MAEQQFHIKKADEEQHLVFGWASVAIRVDGDQIVDCQGDMWDPHDLEEAAYKYVLRFRDAGEEHVPKLRKKAKLVESIVFTKEKMAAIGIPEGSVPEGWWIGFKVHDENTWQKIKSGQYSMFSIEGTGRREEAKGGTPQELGEAESLTFSQALKNMGKG